MEILETLAVIVPAPFVMLQDCAGEVGFVRIVTEYVAFITNCEENVKSPFVAMVILSAPLFWIIKPEPVSPVTLPPIENWEVDGTLETVLFRKRLYDKKSLGLLSREQPDKKTNENRM
jgi:hypothetical protein